MTMALHIAPDHGSVEHIEGGKQRCGAVALVRLGLENVKRRAAIRISLRASLHVVSWHRCPKDHWKPWIEQ
jgi:hypothetical protein